MINLLYSKPPKAKRPKIRALPVDKRSYEDSCEIIDYVRDNVELPPDAIEPIRVRYVRDKPEPSYRVTVLCNSKLPRTVKQKDGRTATVFAGRYVWRQWFVRKVGGEFLWEPSLAEGA